TAATVRGLWWRAGRAYWPTWHRCAATTTPSKGKPAGPSDCLAPGLMEVIKPPGARNDDSTTEVPRRAAAARGTAGARRGRRARHEPQGSVSTGGSAVGY